MSNLAERLKYLRKQSNLRQADLARKLGFSRTTIANYEQNKRNPTPETLCKIADYFNVSVDYLLGRKNTKNLYMNPHIISLKIDFNGNILDCSKGATIFYGYNKEEILKKNITALTKSSKDKFFSNLNNKITFLDKHIDSSNKNFPVKIINKKSLNKKNYSHLIVIPQNQNKLINNDLINLLSSIIYFIDPYSKYHGKNVANIACAIGKKLKLDTDTLNTLKISAKIHDLGKISIPYKILNKPEKLNESEYLVIKKHPVIGFKLLKNINFKKSVARIVLQHHERLDGSGYPEGLKQNDILFESKIIAVADVLEAMISNRSYRSGLDKKEAFNILLKEAGTKFDKQIVEISQKLNLSCLLV
ncbi:MAG: HD domain-containing phosphohydrolase [Bacillota bacterium]